MGFFEPQRPPKDFQEYEITFEQPPPFEDRHCIGWDQCRRRGSQYLIRRIESDLAELIRNELSDTYDQYEQLAKLSLTELLARKNIQSPQSANLVLRGPAGAVTLNVNRT